MTTTTITRLPDNADAMCEAKLSVNCRHGEHRAMYSVEVIDDTTGEVWRKNFCTATMGAWAWRRGAKIPGTTVTTAQPT